MEKNVYEFISNKTNDPIVEWKTCKVSGQEFPIYQSDKDFYDKISPVIDGNKYAIPTPSLCPEQRQRRRLAFRNDRKLYRRTCNATGKQIISIYSPDKAYTVYEQQAWRSDSRDPLNFGKEVDFTKSFFEQFDELMHEVPHLSLVTKMNENSEYVNACGNSKNCYLIFDSDFCEDCMYSSIIKHSKNTVDGLHVYYCENTYNCINCTESFNLISCQECDRSKFLINCSKCSNCEYCTRCSNLVHKKYCIDNIQYTKEEYEAKIASQEFSYTYPTSLCRSTYTVNDEWGIGNNLYGTKNCVFSYNIGYAENIKYCDLVTWANTCHDISSYGWELENSYQACSIWFNTNRIFFSAVITSWCHDVYYSYIAGGCTNIFGCVGLREKSYCILNKQYTKEEYEVLLPKIIQHMQKYGEWWEFFAPVISPFGYNETVAQDYYPRTKQEAVQQGYKRQDIDYDTAIPANMPTLQWDAIPQDIHTVDESILNAILICETTGKPFRIQKQELNFYRAMNIPLPHRHPDQRHEERLQQLPPKKLFLRACDLCNNEVLSVYDRGYSGKVYCESCYNKEIFW
jgi:hypothetical protein